MLAWSRALRRNGVMGLNERNAEYIQRFNTRHLYPLVDDKLRTKRLALDAGIAVPELYGVVESQHDVRRLADIVAGRRDFVIKPAHGTGGDGIVVVASRARGRYGAYRLVDGSIMGEGGIRHHVSNIISGQYSLGGTRDCALLEYRVQSDPVFQGISYQGVPDVRVVVCQGYPIMSMARLPTRRSHGKANLHQGAVGAGIDLSTGHCMSGVLGNEIVHDHPDTGESFVGLEIPHWDELLTLSARCYQLTGLGYLGVDIVLDRNHGPLILELNARPGLNIQIAARCGLRRRLETIEHLPAGMPTEEKVAFVKETFRND